MKYSIILMLIFLVSSPAFADIYKYIDGNGVVCYTDAPLGKKANRIHKENTGEPQEKTQSVRSGSSRSDSGASADLHSIVHEKAANYDVDPSLIKAVIKTESNWNKRAVSRAGAMGLMQLMPATAVDMNVRNPYDPEENIEGGTKYLKYLIERFNGDLTLALAAYNAGPKTVEKFGYVPPITETKQYVKKVLSLYNGKLSYPASVNDSDKKSERIYKIKLDDGTVLFTNSSLALKNPVRF
jgi:Transglycosylase SLT domain/Domain of unknown function (DUF4124)